MCLAIAFLEAKKQQSGQYGVCVLTLRSLRRDKKGSLASFITKEGIIPSLQPPQGA